MNAPILKVEGLTKEYIRNGSPFNALDRVTFELQKGEVLGVIGRNGAGKSTLLKVLSRITAPTGGEISYEGQLTSIIDIGTGFHADLSGKENVFLSALLLGYSKQEVKDVYAQIVAFSGLEDFMDTPVKHYSSGMYLRLAFSIAFHSKISILLLDEVIAVGDADFRAKCYSKLKELRARGTAIVLVSHHLGVIIEQCDRCILLEGGNVLAEGMPFDIVNQYNDLVEHNSGVTIGSKMQVGKENEEFVVLQPMPLAIENYQVDRFEIKEFRERQKLFTTDQITLEFTCCQKESESPFELGITIVNLNDIRVILDSFAFREEYDGKPMSAGTYKIQVVIPADLLSAGLYRVGVILCANRVPVQQFEAVAKFRLHSSDGESESRGMGSIIRPKLDWEICKIEA